MAVNMSEDEMSDLLLCHIDPDLIYPPLLERLRGMLRELQVVNGHEFWAISGFRTEREQMVLYTQGRTRPGGIVTNARALESAHNFGLAVDFVKDGFLDRAGLQPDWRAESYAPLDEACRMYTLEWGGWWEKFKDRPHVQWPGVVTATDLRPLAKIWKAAPGAGMEKLHAVWQHLDAKESSNER